MIKNHKQGCPVRLTFSSVGTVTRNLSTMLDTIYLKPNIAAYSPRRLQNTNEAALFLEAVNKHIWDNNIQYKPTIYAMDVTNFFPSVNSCCSKEEWHQAERNQGCIRRFKNSQMLVILQVEGAFLAPG